MLATHPVTKVLARLQDWEHWNIVQQIAEKEYRISKEEFALLLPEYQKFLVLAGTSAQGISMCSARIDLLWHAHLLHTKLYEMCCKKHFGKMLHHVPNLDARVLHECSTPDDICTGKPCGTCTTDPGKCTGGECDTDDVKGSLRDFVTRYQGAFRSFPPAVWDLPRAEGVVL